jgi:hypothetical protein
MTEELRKQLGLPSPKLALYTFWMADQTITKLIGLIKDPHPWDSLHCDVHGNEKQCFGFQLFHVFKLTMVV